MKGRSDHCEQCGRAIRFVATKAGNLPGLEFCCDRCMGLYRRDLAVWRARLDGETIAEIGARFDLRREKVTQICVAHQAREQRSHELGTANAPTEKGATQK